MGAFTKYIGMKCFRTTGLKQVYETDSVWVLSAVSYGHRQRRVIVKIAQKYVSSV